MQQSWKISVLYYIGGYKTDILLPERCFLNFVFICHENMTLVCDEAIIKGSENKVMGMVKWSAKKDNRGQKHFGSKQWFLGCNHYVNGWTELLYEITNLSVADKFADWFSLIEEFLFIFSHDIIRCRTIFV